MSFYNPNQENNNTSPDPIKNNAEDDNSISQFEAGLAGIASGIIKIPEGFVSLGAELMDATGMSTNAAAKVEQAFDFINPFEEVAEQRAAGRIIEAIVSVGVPAGLGAKIASKLATKALKARKAGKYIELKNPNLKKGMEKVFQLNTKARVQRFAAGVVGGATGEVFVADAENIGTIGDALKMGPTQLNLNEDVDFKGGVAQDPQKDAFRKLMNRAKFGGDSVLYFPAIFGATKFIGGASKFGIKTAQSAKDYLISGSKIDKFIDNVKSTIRPRGKKPEALFLGKMRQKGGEMSDANFAKEQVVRIQQEVRKNIAPGIKSIFNSKLKFQKQKQQDELLQDLNELMFSGDIRKEIGQPKIYKKVIEQMKEANMSQESIDTTLTSVNNVRKKFVNMLETIQEGSTASVDLPKNLQGIKPLIGDNISQLLGNTYRIFSNPAVEGMSAFKPAKEKIDKVKEIFKRASKKNGRELTENELDYTINDILTNAMKMDPNKKFLPSYSFTNRTIGATDARTVKSFQRIHEKSGLVIGQGSKAFRELFGITNDIRQSIFHGVGMLSAISRRSKFIDDILDADEIALKTGGRRMFYESEDEAVKNLGAGGLNKIVKLDETLAPMFKDGVLVNRLKGLYTSSDIANGFKSVDDAVKFVTGDKSNKFAQGAVDLYKYTVLTPKAGAQIAKTVLSPTTHVRNFLSASAFSLANGTLFTNPKLFAQAFKSATDTIQLGVRSPQAMKDYQEALELGVVNTNTRMGDMQNLLKDMQLSGPGKFGDGIMKRMLRKMANLTEPAQALYTAEDDFYKLFNFKVEGARLANAYAKAGIKKTEREIKEEAADIVRNTIPNYAYVSDLVRTMRVTPMANFASFPAGIMVSGAGIFTRMMKELRDPITRSINPFTSTNPLKGIGMKRLLGSASAFGSVGVAVGAGYEAMYGTTNNQMKALDRFVAPYEKPDKKFLIKEEILDDKGKPTGKNKYYYQNYSNNNAYDYLEAPFRTLLKSIQSGIDNEEQLTVGFVKGISEGFSNFVDPFVSESIAPETIFDLVFREGQTRNGKKLFTKQTPLQDKIDISIRHILNSQAPFSMAQLKRIYYARRGIPDPGTGQEYDLDKELPGMFGWRIIPVDPLRSMTYKISNYDKEKKNSIKEFTFGTNSRLLSGGVKTKEEVIKQFFITNQSLFDAQQNMHLDMKAANQFEVTDGEIAEVWNERNRSSSEYGPLFQGKFKPYVPSKGIAERFYKIAEKTGVNPFEEALPEIKKMIGDFNKLRLDKPFRLKLKNYLGELGESNQIEPGFFNPNQSALPETPGVNPQVVSTPMPAPGTVSQSGLTPTEQALLSPEEQQIRLRQRGMA